MSGYLNKSALISAMNAVAVAAAAGMQLTRANVGRLLARSGTQALSQPAAPRYTNHRGHSVAQGKRMATKRRNVLRQRGSHRRAVR